MPRNTPTSTSSVTVSADRGAATCCGGAPAADASACCALDEAQKAAGQAGCGCSAVAAPSAAAKAEGAGCCAARTQQAGAMSHR